jgi:hypothetical protein
MGVLGQIIKGMLCMGAVTLKATGLLVVLALFGCVSSHLRYPANQVSHTPNGSSSWGYL